MADSKITALTALTAADPANDMMPIVDVSDTSMAASGTTKRISINNILACSPSATLASATITGDLTVDTSTLKVDSANNRVGIGTASPSFNLHVVGSTDGRLQLEGASGYGMVFVQASSGNTAQIQLNSNGGSGRRYLVGSNSSGQFLISDETGSATRLAIDSTGVFTFQNVGGVAGTAMTLNSTGLGVGGSPGYKLDINSGAVNTIAKFTSNTSSGYIRFADSTAETGYIGNGSGVIPLAARTDFGIVSVGSLVLGSNNARSVTIDTSGNVGVGVTPSAWAGGSPKVIDVGSYSSYAQWNNATGVVNNAYLNSSSAWIYRNTAAASAYYQIGGAHTWQTAASGTAGGTATFTTAMAIDASSNVVVGNAAVATTATDGFLYIPGCAGTPTGTPTAQTGRVPLVVDTTNNKLYFYSGGSWVAAN